MRILTITEFLPFPADAGHPLRVNNLMSRVAREHEVWLATFVSDREAREGFAHRKEWCAGVLAVEREELGAMSRPYDFLRFLARGTPPDLRLKYSAELNERIRELTGKIDFDIVQIEDSSMAIYRESLCSRNGSSTILDFIDIVSTKSAQLARVERKVLRKLRLAFLSRTMRSWEPRVAGQFDCCVTVSLREKEVLVGANPKLRVEVVPNGVDTQEYRPLPEGKGSPNLLFIGNMDYQPNVDAMTFFCSEVFPQLRQRRPELQMWVVGRDPRPEVERLEGNGVHVTGRVEDVRPYYEQSTVCVVPLRAGAGTRLKILEAMALGRPVVSTSIGCEGLDVVDGEHIVVANSAKSLYKNILQLSADPARRRHIRNKARKLVEERFDWDMLAMRLMNVYGEIRSSMTET